MKLNIKQKFKTVTSKALLVTMLSTLAIGITPIDKVYASGQVWNYGYNGSVQYWTAPYTGNYKLEVWGGQGGKSGYNTSTGMYGGYSTGIIHVNSGDVLYVYVGGQGGVGSDGGHATGGWNGGGTGDIHQGGGGGGATDMRLYGQDFSNRVIVAGGGGGAGQNHDQGFNGNIGGYSLGVGQNAVYDNGAGGGGYYGGVTGTGGPDGISAGWNDQGGSSGSNYTGSLSSASNQYSVRSGSGYATITQLDIPPTLSISSPVVNAQYSPGTNMALTGSIYDVDGVSGYAMNVNYNIDGGSTVTNPNINDSTVSTPFSYSVALPSNMSVGNHTLNVWATDSQGAGSSVQSITFSIRDTIAPTLTLTPSTTAWTNGNVSITATGSDNVGVTQIQTPSLSWVTGSSTTYTVGANGTYNFVAKDGAGNQVTKSITVSNIDKTVPSITFTKSPSTWTNGAVTITATGVDNSGGSGVVSMTKPDNTVVSGNTATYTVSSNSTLTFKATDSAGNVSTQTVSVSNIDTSAPTASLSIDDSSWTNGSVTINVTGTDVGGAGVSSITTPNGNIVTASTTSYTVSANGTYTFTVKDSAGNVGSQSITITNVDTTPPTLTVTPNTTSWVNGNYAQKHTLRLATYAFNTKETQVTPATYLDGNVQQSLTRGLNLVAYDSNFNVIKQVSYDTYGTTTLGDNLATDINSIPNGSLIVLQSFDAYHLTSNLRTALQNIGVPNASTMNTDADSGVANQNERITFQFVIYKGESTPLLFNYDRNGYTSADNTIMVGDAKVYETINSVDSGSKPNTIILPNGSRLYNNSLSLTNVQIKYLVFDNGTYNFSTTDIAGNSTSKSTTVGNIDSGSATLSLTQNPTAWTNGNVIITATAVDTSSGVKSIMLPDGNVIYANNVPYTATANGTYSFTVTDNVGNTLTKTITVTNIDKVAPNLTLTPNSTNWTNGTTTINVTASDSGSGIKQIVLPNGNIVTGNTASFTVTDVGVYYFTAKDNVGNTATSYYVVTNIDKENPTVTVTNNQNWSNASGINVTISATDK